MRRSSININRFLLIITSGAVFLVRAISLSLGKFSDYRTSDLPPAGSSWVNETLAVCAWRGSWEPFPGNEGSSHCPELAPWEGLNYTGNRWRWCIQISASLGEILPSSPLPLSLCFQPLWPSNFVALVSPVNISRWYECCLWSGHKEGTI